MTAWHLQLFGDPCLFNEEKAGFRLPGGLCSLLLGRLVLAGRSGCSRDVLAEELWPDVASSKSRHRLRVALLALRHFLKSAGPSANEIVEADRTTIRLVFSKCNSDVNRFDKAIGKGDWAQADSLYQGDLLPECDDSLIARERDRLRTMHRNALLNASINSESSGDLSTAILYAERAILFDPHDETLVLRLIRLLARDNRTESAQRLYRKPRRDYRQVNEEQLPVSTRRQIRSWFNESRNSMSEPTVPTLAFVPPLPTFLSRFFGRTEDIAELHRLLEDTGHRLITATGSAGSGKTRLAIEAARTQDRETYFVSLAGIDDANFLGEKIIGALHHPRDLKVHPLDQAIEILGRVSMAAKPFYQRQNA